MVKAKGEKESKCALDYYIIFARAPPVREGILISKITTAYVADRTAVKTISLVVSIFLALDILNATLTNHIFSEIKLCSTL